MRWPFELSVVIIPLLWTKQTEASAIKRPFSRPPRKSISHSYSSTSPTPVLPQVQLNSASKGSLEGCSCSGSTCADDRSPIPLLGQKSPLWMIQAVCGEKQRQNAKDIYQGLMAMMIRVEDALRSSNCAAFNVHKQPMIPSSLLTDYLQKPNMQSAMFGEDEEQLLGSARLCRLDYKIFHRLVRLAMRKLMNEATCARLDQSRKDVTSCYYYYSMLNRQLLPSTSSLTTWNNGKFWNPSNEQRSWSDKDKWPRPPPNSNGRYSQWDRAGPPPWQSDEDKWSRLPSDSNGQYSQWDQAGPPPWWSNGDKWPRSSPNSNSNSQHAQSDQTGPPSWWSSKDKWPKSSSNINDRYAQWDQTGPHPWQGDNSTNSGFWPTSSGGNIGWSKSSENLWQPSRSLQPDRNGANPWLSNGADQPWPNNYIQPRKSKRCAAQNTLPPPPPPYDGTPL